MNRRRPVAVLSLLAIVTVAACGVPTGPDSLEAIPEDDLSDRLLAPLPTTTSTTIAPSSTVVDDQPATTLPTTTAPTVPTEEIPVYFLSRGQLSSIQLAAPVAPQPNDLILLLEAGPEGPLAAQLENLIEPGLIVSTMREGGTITIELDEPTFRRIPPRDQLEGIGQIVLTFLTSLRGVGTAAFTIDGEALRVPTENGEFTDEPVSVDDYDALDVDRDDAIVPTTTTTTSTTTTVAPTTTDPDA